MFSIVVVPIYIHTSSFGGFPFSSQPLQHLLFAQFLWWPLLPLWGSIYCSFGCSYLIISNVEHIFMWFLEMWVLYLENCLLRSSARLFSWYWAAWPFYTFYTKWRFIQNLESNALLVTSFANVFSHSVGCLFILHMFFFFLWKSF